MHSASFLSLVLLNTSWLTCNRFTSDKTSFSCLQHTEVYVCVKHGREKKSDFLPFLFPVFGIAISVLMLQLIQVPSLKLSTMLLVLLLVYDVFWVRALLLV